MLNIRTLIVPSCLFILATLNGCCCLVAKEEYMERYVPRIPCVTQPSASPTPSSAPVIDEDEIKDYRFRSPL
jgi:hypothetical protein